MDKTTAIDEKRIELELDIEELEEIIAPGRGTGMPNHNETLVVDVDC